MTENIETNERIIGARIRNIMDSVKSVCMDLDNGATFVMSADSDRADFHWRVEDAAGVAQTVDESLAKLANAKITSIYDSDSKITVSFDNGAMLVASIVDDELSHMWLQHIIQ